MSDPFHYDVFLSHSSKDKRSKPPTSIHDTGGNPVVRDVAERLRKDGLRVWFDEWEIRPGDSIPAKIEEGLERSRVLVLCMSANAFGSDWAQLESGTFRFRDPLNKERRFLPRDFTMLRQRHSGVISCRGNFLAKRETGELKIALSKSRLSQ